VLSFEPANVNADGSLKTDGCGYCLSSSQSTNIAVVWGSAAAALALLALVLVASRFEYLCKLRFFKAFAILCSTLALLSLLATITVGFFAALSLGACSTLMSEPVPTDSISQLFEPTPNGLDKVGDYLPVTAKSVPSNTYLTSYGGSFSCQAPNGVACYDQVYLVPSGGAIMFTIAVIILFLFLIFVGIRVDFSLTHVAPANALVSVYALKPAAAGRNVYL
jgi:hypothetical protein